jgi:hypothetical protein
LRGRREPSGHPLVERVGEHRVRRRPLVGEQQRQLGELGVAGIDRLTGERRVDRIERRGHVGIHRGVVKQSHCRPS